LGGRTDGSGRGVFSPPPPPPPHSVTVTYFVVNRRDVSPAIGSFLL
jgi:hypothetical protein